MTFDHNGLSGTSRMKFKIIGQMSMFNSTNNSLLEICKRPAEA